MAAIISFIDIFKHDGLYKARHFKEGQALEIKDGQLYMLEYTSPQDFLPLLIDLNYGTIDRSLVDAGYKNILLKKQLFQPFETI